MKKPIKRKPAARNPPALDKAIAALDSIERRIISLGAATAGISGILANRFNQPGDINRSIDEMGRALSDQIHLLVKCVPPNKGDVLQMKLDQLERRIALLEKEATYTVRHIIAQPPREKRDGTYTAQEPTTGSGEADPIELGEEGQSGTHDRAQPDDLGQ